MRAPTERFTDRVDAYIKFRPQYPEAVIAYLIENSTDYQKVDHRKAESEHLEAFFALYPYQRATFHNFQTFDLAGLRGRVQSSSYIPNRRITLTIRINKWIYENLFLIYVLWVS